MVLKNKIFGQDQKKTEKVTDKVKEERLETVDLNVSATNLLNVSKVSSVGKTDRYPFRNNEPHQI